jgi:uncharacterized protein (TIGR02147 family)
MVFSFQNSRDFLRSYIGSLPKNGWGEIQRWADFLGLQASYVSQILSGAKALNIDQSLALARHIGLKENEIDYFVLLVEKERAASHETKKYFDLKLEAAKAASKDLSKRLPKDRDLSAVEKSIFYSSWHYSAIRLFCSLSKVGKSLVEIADRFKLKRHEVAQILEFLCESGLCSEKKGRYFVGSQRTFLESDSPHIHRHRQNWRVRSLSQIETTQPDELVFSAPFSVSAVHFLELREQLAEFLESFYKKVSETDPEEMAVLNIDLMKLR